MKDPDKQKQEPETRKTVIIACRVMQHELDAILRKQQAREVEVRYLDQNLHRTPEKMAGLIQAEVDSVADWAEQIVLGYGLCSNGIVGVTARNQNICIPRVHDCIALLLGSREAYFKAFKERAGTYYLTPGWVAEEKDPLGMVENEYAPKMGAEMAEWGIKEELKHYSHIVLIDTQVGDISKLRKRAKANAAYLGKAYDEVRGSRSFFERILFGPYDEQNFVCLQPGESASQKPFMK